MQSTDLLGVYMCGIFGIIGHPEAAKLTYFGLYALQHRGQESAGISSFDGKNAYSHKGMGLVCDIFSEEHLNEHLKGHIAIGHTRYSTTGKPEVRNAQPIIARTHGASLVVAHNGNLINTVEIRAELENLGSIFQTTSDSEIFVHLIARALKYKNIEEAVYEAVQKVKGAFSLLVQYEGKFIALRDPKGFHPLVLGQLPSIKGCFVFSSESCAFDLIEAEYLREVQPGEMIIIEQDSKEIRSREFAKPDKISQCIFELIYFARPDSVVFSEDVYLCRKKLGAQIAKEMPSKADMVVPFPDSGIYCAVGLANEAKIPYEHALIRNHYVGRTFIQPSQTMRQFSVQVKINPAAMAIKHKKLLVVDDSIVRGTTVRTRCAKLREHGAKEVHFRVSSPPIKFPCFYGIDFPSPQELVANQISLEELAGKLGLDSLHYLTLNGLQSCVQKPNNYCYACFNGDYPTTLPCHQDKMALECD